MIYRTISIATTLFFCLGMAVQADLITNGDFSGGTGGTWEVGSATGGGNSVPTGWTGYATSNSALRVDGGQYIVYNAADKAPGSWIQQTVNTLPGRWYMLQWDEPDGPGSYPQRAVTQVDVWDGATPSGASGDILSNYFRYPRTGRAQLFQADSTLTTVRFGDLGSNSTSNDGALDNVSLTPSALNGHVNIAPIYGTATSLSHHNSFGIEPMYAVDNHSNYGDANTTFHSAGNANEWWKLTYPDPVLLTEIEIQARSGFNNRNGDFVDLFDSEGGLIESLPITDGALWEATGRWTDVAELIVRNGSGATVPLNLAEVRTFSEFVNGIMTIPEPGTWTLFALSLIGAGFFFRRRRRVGKEK